MPLLDNLTGLTKRDSTLVMPGERDELLQRCCDALESTPRFSVLTVSEDQFRIDAAYRRPPVWGKLTVTLLPEGMGSTRINIAVTVLPNLFTLPFAPQPRIVGRLTRALGQQAGPIRAALTSAGPGQNRRSPGTLSKPPPRESGGPSNRRS